MNKPTFSESNFDLWLLIGKVNHSIFLVRQRELTQYDIPVRQLQVLRTVQALGPKATISEVAKQVEREDHVVSRQIIRMEKDGLINRIKNSTKSKLFRLEITDKGLDIIKGSDKSKAIDTIMSFLTDEARQQMTLSLNQILINTKEYNE